ncbi:serpin B6-like protein, partial [Dinothrombium tinctorium]
MYFAHVTLMLIVIIATTTVQWSTCAPSQDANDQRPSDADDIFKRQRTFRREPPKKFKESKEKSSKLPPVHPPTVFSDTHEPLPKHLQALVDANNNFGFKLVNSLIKYSGNKNIFIAPLSLFSTLITLYSASSKQTNDEIVYVLNLQNLDEDDIQNGFRSLLHNLLYETGPDTTLKILNALLVDNKVNISKQYTDRIRTYYNAYLEKVGFSSEPDYVLQWTNQLVSWWTDGLIPTLLTREPHPTTKLLLMNAIYFKSKWAEVFNPKYTTEKTFTNQDKSESKVPMMLINSKFRMFCDNETLNFCAVDIPYTGHRMAFTIFLPMNGIDLSFLDKNLNTETLKLTLSSLETRSLELGLPRMSLNTNYNLHKPLEDLGMKTAFSSDKANFSKIGTNNGQLFVKEAKHKTVLEVNEEGTVAAAATYAVIGNRQSPQRLYVNHPFIFIIRDIKTGTILFHGRI